MPIPAFTQLMGAHPAAGGWTPASLPNLVAWYDASDAASITSSGGAVSQWNDLSGNGRHLTQSTGANQPTTGATTVNSLNVIDFDGATSKMDGPSLGGLSVASYVFVVKTGTGMDSGIHRMFDGKSGRHSMAVNGTMYQGSSEPSWASSTLPDNTAEQITGIFQGNSSTNGYLNGTIGTGGNAGSDSITTWRLGCESGGGLQFFPGSFAEFIVCSGALGSTDRTTAEAYLKAKWGTP